MGTTHLATFEKERWITQVLTIEIALEYKLLERLLFHFKRWELLLQILLQYVVYTLLFNNKKNP
jgi:hypothetical protein